MDASLPPKDRIVNALARWDRPYPPTYRELCRRAGISSTSEMSRFLKELREEGRIGYEEGKFRTVHLLIREAV